MSEMGEIGETSGTAVPRAGRAWAWTGLTLIALAAAFLASFAIATAPGRFGWAPQWRVDLAAWLVLFGAFGAGGTLAAARLAFGAWPRVRPADAALAAAGLAIAAVEEPLLHEWAESSIGHYDWQLVGPVAALSFVTVLLAVALFAARVSPPGAALAPRLAVTVGAVAVLAIALSNVPALADGIGQGGLVAVPIGFAAIYALLALALAVVTRR